MPLIIAFLQVASFNYNWGWCIVFIYSILFFTCSTHIKIAFVQGYMYGLLFFIAHSSGFLTFIDVNEFAWYYKGLPLFFFMLCALYSALYFIFLSLNKKYCNGVLRYIIYVVLTGGYLWWLNTKCFVMFLVNVGNPLLFPFITIINNVVLTHLYYKIGAIGGTVCLLSINSALTYLLEKYYYRLYSLLLLLLLMSLIIIDAFVNHKPGNSNPNLAVIHMIAPNSKQKLSQILNQMNKKIKDKLEQTTAPIVLFAYPESALSFSFSHKSLQRLAQNFSYNSNIYVLLGSFFSENERLYNSCFLIEKGRIILHYDKKNLVPFWEYLPAQTNFFLNKLFGNFLKGLTPFTPGATDHCSFFYAGDTLFIPALCAELFLNDFSSYDSSINLIVLLNDSHFKEGFLHKVLLLYSRFLAGTQKRKVFHIATFRGYEIDENGLIVKKL